MSDIVIQSHAGPYTVEFNNEIQLSELGTHYIIDANVYDRCGSINSKNVIIIDATEENKSLQATIPVIEKLIAQGLKRDSHLVAVGGGITQDITCFIANTYMRGVKWTFVPTTLLAQADSCIGSKSSINFGSVKNLLGSFTPPTRVIISDQWLATLSDKDITSGIGEIIKLYLIDGQLIDPATIRQDLAYHIRQTLKIKQYFIEKDEFDQGIRNILNYGHCFGHALEASTNFAVPHGIAVTIGMQIANQLALNQELLMKEYFNKMSTILKENYREYADVTVDVHEMLTALTKDKKNTGSKINVILPEGSKIVKKGFEAKQEFWDQAILAITQTLTNACR